MINKLVSLSIAICGITSVWAQTTPGQAPEPNSYPAGFNTNQLGVGGVLFSNRVGQTFSTDALAIQLQNLRSAIDQAFPLLSAFNESYSNSLTTSKQTTGGALSGIVSDVLRRNQTAGQNSTSGQTSLNASYLLSVLQGMLNTNSTGAVSSAPSNAQDLAALQDHLQPAMAILQRLNVSPAQNPSAAPSSNGNLQLNQSLTPTGR